ncbi:MAG: rRNA maturation RNase YbeY [Chloroflexi bacterium]|jgi:probable rRNA maturation factor|nr:rRNA maturation RNase YbeY [Chloroflexota bacterium]
MIPEKFVINIFVNPKFKTKIDQSIIRNAVQTTLESEGNTHVSLSIKFTKDKEVRLLNKAYRNIDKTTDVLAFNQGYIDPETDLLYLGDIIISCEQAQLQANENGRSVTEECALLTVHGTLHLLGYDHATPGEKAIMWKKQDHILKSVLRPGLEDDT